MLQNQFYDGLSSMAIDLWMKSAPLKVQYNPGTQFLMQFVVNLKSES